MSERGRDRESGPLSHATAPTRVHSPLMGFRRIAIVNRGEPAMRLINAVAEYNIEHAAALRTIALYTDPDRHAMFVREADESYCLGPAHVTGADGIRRVAYVDYALLERALVESGAEAAWVGWGFVAEHAEFAELCQRLGVVFLGPGPEVMRRLGDKITSKQIAEASEVPVSPWSGEPVETVAEAHAHAKRIGYPLLVKATAGGGGRGIRRVDDESELDAAFHGARSEAESAFGNGTLFLEKMVSGARHIEVQIVGDHAGTVWAVGVRDCSAQRRNQKLLEEAPSPALSPDQDRFIREAAARLGRNAGYQSAGTVEFLFDPVSGSFYFLEVNARLQVEHPVTELTTGVDMVKLQIAIGAGNPLVGDPPATSGHAIEARLNAEDPDLGFAPAPGVVDMLRLPLGPGMRIDTGVEEGDEIASEFDSMVAKVIAVGVNRQEALARLGRALSQMRVVIRNGASNKAFLERLLRHPDFVSGDIDVTWVDRVIAADGALEHDNAGAALLAGAIAAYRNHIVVEGDVFQQSAARGRPLVDAAVGQRVELRLRGERYTLKVYQLGPETWRVEVDGVTIDATVEDLGRVGARLVVAGRRFRVLTAVHGATYYIEVDGVAHRITHDEGGVVRAPSPAVVVSLPVAPGDTVQTGDRLAVIEAMKMETAITAEFPGVVREVLVRENVQVGPGTALLVVDPIESDDDITAARIDFLPLRTEDLTHRDRCPHHLDELRRMLLGWDIDPAQLDESAGPDCPEPATTAERFATEDALLGIFVDIISLFRRDPGDDDLVSARRSSEEYLFNYLRDPASRGDGLPADFVRRLERTIGHYGLESLDPSPRLDATMLRIAKAHARMADQTAPVLRILEDRLVQGPDADDPALRDVLERLIVETRGRYEAVHDIAREVHYQTYDVPHLERARHEAYAEVEQHLTRLGGSPPPDERRQRLDAIATSTHSLYPLLSARLVAASPELRAMILEVMARRRYRIRDLVDVGSAVVEGFGVATATYHHEGRRYLLLMPYAPLERLADLLGALTAQIAAAPPGLRIVVDLQIWRGGSAAGTDAIRDELLADLDTWTPPAPVHLVIVTVSTPSSGSGRDDATVLTFRTDDAGRLIEDDRYRNLHPMMAHRLELARLGNFAIQRLPTAGDIYLFHGVAYDNPKDERLFVFAEVRDLTPIHDERGQVVRVPEFERIYRESLGSIRRFQARRTMQSRMHWNRAFLNIWPVVDFAEVDVAAFIGRLAPDTEGTGLERLTVKARLVQPDGSIDDRVLEVSNPTGREVRFTFRDGEEGLIPPLRAYDQKVVRLRSRGLVHPHELVRMLAPAQGEARSDFPVGDFVEYDLDGDRLAPVDRGPGENVANVVVGVVTSYTPRYPEGMRRVIVLGDPSRGMGSLAEPECRRIVAALDLADELGVPLEWFSVSAGALIAMESGTENMDWIGHVLRRIVGFTQDGGEINVVVAGVNVGAQPYWNAEATMLMHTKGILVMTPESAMVLTGKEALDYSGGVSAEDNQGIGGYERIMGPNGQAQYFARDLAEACRVLIQHYEYSYVATGERFPRPAPTTDPIDRDVTPHPHGGELATIGDVFSETANPGRKRPFDMRRVMESVVDADLPTLERWYGMQDAEIAVVWDAFLGGNPVTLIGFESTPIPRLGAVPVDGPGQWTSGTLFPRSSKKTARAINAASGNRPVVILANLSGFDGSPESLRNWQLEYGAEIGRAVVNFDGPLVFCVVSRYHGGAFVVFSQRLNDDMEVAAVAGSHASVIGGAPAAAVVFAREVNRRTEQDPRVAGLRVRADAAAGAEKARLLAELDVMRPDVHSEKLGEVADEFDAVHDVTRARDVGSVHHIVPPADLRPYLVDAVARGIAKVLDRLT